MCIRDRPCIACHGWGRMLVRYDRLCDHCFREMRLVKKEEKLEEDAEAEEILSVTKTDRSDISNISRLMKRRIHRRNEERRLFGRLRGVVDNDNSNEDGLKKDVSEGAGALSIFGDISERPVGTPSMISTLSKLNKRTHSEINDEPEIPSPLLVKKSRKSSAPRKSNEINLLDHPPSHQSRKDKKPKEKRENDKDNEVMQPNEEQGVKYLEIPARKEWA
eukprot:TRINITY_DN11763_c0_g1_i1.p1 TRINITY_DN11763_c0_g1~~TRINITY_DN11763_c0_g1_i1.p1  ORF type:complete len:219 (+),score=29.87 TRINITY_DN11763_c0_g1_i1:63-719(+)